MSSESTYTLKAQLVELISLIAEDWPELEEDVKKQIVLKIEERAPHCTPGFHDGLHEIAKFLTKDDSLEAYLQRIREDLVTKASLELGNRDIHDHENVFCTARTQDYGVRANVGDIHVGNINNERVITKLSHVFKRHYRPLNILSGLQRWVVFLSFAQNTITKGLWRQERLIPLRRMKSGLISLNDFFITIIQSRLN